ncbi:Streptogramin A acetyltransferase [compost metagenome]
MWIGNSVTILSGVRIGNGAVIGAGTVVTKDVPAYAVVAGNPMRIVKYRFDIAQINKLQKIKWWNWNREEIEKNKGWFAEKIEKFTHHFEKSYDEIIESITMKKKSKSILFIADFDEKYSIWEKVLTEYISHFSSEDDVTLLLRIETSERFDFNINAVQNIISKKINLPDILIINDILYEEKSLFEEVDYFITSRVPKTIQYVDFADEFNVKILSGVDSPIFLNL